MLPRLLLLALVAAFGWIVSRVLGTSTRRPRGPRRQPAERSGEPMVRDRVCNTFLPASKAIVLEHGGRTHHFCSDACRERFVHGLTGPTAPAAGEG